MVNLNQVLKVFTKDKSSNTVCSTRLSIFPPHVDVVGCTGNLQQTQCKHGHINSYTIIHLHLSESSDTEVKYDNRLIGMRLITCNSGFSFSLAGYRVRLVFIIPPNCPHVKEEGQGYCDRVSGSYVHTRWGVYP